MHLACLTLTCKYIFGTLSLKNKVNKFIINATVIFGVSKLRERKCGDTTAMIAQQKGFEMQFI